MQRLPGPPRFPLGAATAAHRGHHVTQTKTGALSPEKVAEAAHVEDEIAYLAKRHRISPAIVREIIRKIGSIERSAVEREIRKGLARR